MTYDRILWRLMRDLYECAGLYEGVEANVSSKFWAAKLQERIEEYAESLGLDCAEIFEDLAKP